MSSTDNILKFPKEKLDTLSFSFDSNVPILPQHKEIAEREIVEAIITVGARYHATRGEQYRKNEKKIKRLDRNMKIWAVITAFSFGITAGVMLGDLAHKYESKKSTTQH